MTVATLLPLWLSLQLPVAIVFGALIAGKAVFAWARGRVGGYFDRLSECGE